jgi:thioredoxin reductase
MLYFSKLRIFSVIIFTLILSYFSLSNFFKIDDNFFSKNIKLGLDLQGGSYLLLEIDNKPVITQKLQNKVMELKNFFKDKNIIVVGGGDSAMEEASFLTKFAKKVTIIHRREVFKASKIMLDRAKNNPLIDIIVNKSIESINGSQKDGVSSVILRDTITDQKSTFNCEGVFYGIGHNPNTELFEGIIDLNDNGYIITKPDSTLTNIPGVFACGDVQDDHYRQAITAAGSGCMSAIDAEKYLEDVE